MPRVRVGERSTASEGEVLTRSFPSTWSMVRNSGTVSMGAPQLTPPSVDLAKAVVLP
ncbi:MAG: hypothetical protein QM767_27360 [Anaeromyxobacter sp.]